jgi:P27 family predicted phage terminase small subunit
MPGCGPPPTPTEILKLRGSTVPGRRRTAEPKFQSKAPSCPSWLGKEAKAEWRRQVKLLLAVKVIAESDRAMLATYCEAWGEFVDLCHTIDEVLRGDRLTGYTEVIQKGLIGAKNKAAERVLKLADRFGFSPSARTRLQVQPGNDQPSGVSGFARDRKA